MVIDTDEPIVHSLMIQQLQAIAFGLVPIELQWKSELERRTDSYIILLSCTFYFITSGFPLSWGFLKFRIYIKETLEFWVGYSDLICKPLTCNPQYLHTHNMLMSWKSGNGSQLVAVQVYWVQFVIYRLTGNTQDSIQSYRPATCSTLLYSSNSRQRMGSISPEVD